MKNLRTEIVLTDQSDVAFWFSLSFQVAAFGARASATVEPLVVYQIESKLDALFPKRRDVNERDRFRG